MRMFLLTLIAFTASSIAFEQKSDIALEGIAYSGYKDEIATKGSSELTLTNDYFQTDITLEFLYSSEYKQRRYFLLNELYITKEFEDYSVNFGKSVQYWGELEGFNIADVYNQKNYLLDPFDKGAKYGAWGGGITRYFDENALEFGMRFYEEEIELPTDDTPYAPFTSRYDKALRFSGGKYAPTFYLKTNIVSDAYLDSETSIVFLHGYDNKRAFVPKNTTTLTQYAYKVNKALLFAHILYNDTIFKTELAYTDVTDDAQMSDYTQLSIGAEHTLYAPIGSSDITFFGEYYRYLYEDAETLKNVDISEVYDNDVFFALRLNFNDIQSSEIKGGVLYDVRNGEQVYKIKAKTRIYKSIVIKGEYLQIHNVTNETLLGRFGDSSRLRIALHYNF